MAYDSARQRTVLFGGFPSIGVPAGDTWEWNGEFWTQAEDLGPSARGSHAMAYDVARGQMILFGGKINHSQAKESASGDTWAWDGQAWTQVADSGPSARAGSSMAYDRDRERVVLFGGDKNQDTWQWDGLAWTQAAADGPPGRTAAAMAYDNIRGRVVLFGGEVGGNGGFINDTWEFDGVAWTRVGDTGPQPRSSSAMVFGGTRTILFGGEFLSDAGGHLNTLGTLKDTWEWSGKFWTQRQDFGPRDRGAHQMAYDSGRDRVVLFGGVSVIPGPAQESVHLNDTWELPGDAIALTALTFPRPLIADGVATVSLSGPSPIGGIAVSLSANGPLEIPGSVLVAEGRTSAVFPVRPTAFDPAQPPVIAIVTAKLGASSVSSGVHIGPL